MILPVVAYGDPVLRKKGVDIEENTPEVQKLITDMLDTMRNADGVGIAAPQVGKSLRLFVIEITGEDEKDYYKQVFINPQITAEEGEPWAFKEGCLSIPDIREDVMRKPVVNITYLDEHFNKHSDTFSGMIARVIQHEYDHIEGILFTDKLPILRKTLLKGRLDDISRGKVRIDYKMRFPALKNKR